MKKIIPFLCFLSILVFCEAKRTKSVQKKEKSAPKAKTAAKRNKNASKIGELSENAHLDYHNLMARARGLQQTFLGNSPGLSPGLGSENSALRADNGTSFEPLFNLENLDIPRLEPEDLGFRWEDGVFKRNRTAPGGRLAKFMRKTRYSANGTQLRPNQFEPLAPLFDRFAPRKRNPSQTFCSLSAITFPLRNYADLGVVLLRLELHSSCKRVPSLKFLWLNSFEPVTHLQLQIDGMQFIFVFGDPQEVESDLGLTFEYADIKIINPFRAIVLEPETLYGRRFVRRPKNETVADLIPDIGLYKSAMAEKAAAEARRKKKNAARKKLTVPKIRKPKKAKRKRAVLDFLSSKLNKAKGLAKNIGNHAKKAFGNIGNFAKKGFGMFKSMFGKKRRKLYNKKFAKSIKKSEISHKKSPNFPKNKTASLKAKKSHKINKKRNLQSGRRLFEKYLKKRPRRLTTEIIRQNNQNYQNTGRATQEFDEVDDHRQPPFAADAYAPAPYETPSYGNLSYETASYGPPPQSNSAKDKRTQKSITAVSATLARINENLRRERANPNSFFQELVSSSMHSVDGENEPETQERKIRPEETFSRLQQLNRPVKVGIDKLKPQRDYWPKIPWRKVTETPVILAQSESRPTWGPTKLNKLWKVRPLRLCEPEYFARLKVMRMNCKI